MAWARHRMVTMRGGLLGGGGAVPWIEVVSSWGSALSQTVLSDSTEHPPNSTQEKTSRLGGRRAQHYRCKGSIPCARTTARRGGLLDRRRGHGAWLVQATSRLVDVSGTILALFWACDGPVLASVWATRASLRILVRPRRKMIPPTWDSCFTARKASLATCPPREWASTLLLQ